MKHLICAIVFLTCSIGVSEEVTVKDILDVLLQPPKTTTVKTPPKTEDVQKVVLTRDQLNQLIQRAIERGKREGFKEGYREGYMDGLTHKRRDNEN